MYLDQNEIPDYAIVDDNEMVLAEDEMPHEITFDQMELTVHRSTLLKDLISAFCDPKVLTSTLFIKVVAANGVEEKGEGRGVARDVLTEFWHLFFQSLAIGAAAKVPVTIIRRSNGKRLREYCCMDTAEREYFPFLCRQYSSPVVSLGKTAFLTKCC